jgi:hypothetical protein
MRNDADKVLHPAIRIGAQAALTTLDKYMTIMGESDIYWMATGTCLLIVFLILITQLTYTLPQHSVLTIS